MEILVTALMYGMIAGYFAACAYGAYYLWKLTGKKVLAIFIGLLSVFLTPAVTIILILLIRLNRFVKNPPKIDLEAVKQHGTNFQQASQRVLREEALSLKEEAKKFTWRAIQRYYLSHNWFRYSVYACITFIAFYIPIQWDYTRLREEFGKERESVLSRVNTAYEQGQYKTVIRIADKYARLRDRELNTVYEKALVEDLKTIQGDDFETLEKRKDVYDELVYLNRSKYEGEQEAVAKQISAIEEERKRQKEIAQEIKEHARANQPENARYQCKEAVKARSKFPSKVEFISGTTNDRAANVSVVGVVNLMNGFGAMIPHTYMCQFEGPDLIEVSVSPGG